MTKTKSFNKNTKHKALYDALMESILKDEDAMDKGVADKSKKRKPDDADRHEGPPAGPDQGLKRKKTGKETEPSKNAKLTRTSKGTTKSQPNLLASLHKQRRQCLRLEILKGHRILEKTWVTLMNHPLSMSIQRTGLRNQKGLQILRPAYNILKRTCRSYVKLEYNMEECYKALTDQLDWNNPKGDRYPFDLSKPLPLVLSRNRQIVPVDYFFNNDLAYLQRESTDRTYTTFLTKTKAAKYDLPGIEYMVRSLWSPIKVSYDKHALLGYVHLDEIEVRRSDHQLYKFREGDFPRLHLNDIEDMLLLVVQHKLFNLKGDVIVYLAAALRMFTRRIVIQKRVEDLQLGVGSYQKKLNISKPRIHEGDLSQRAPYTTLLDSQGVIYEDNLNRKRLMRSDELHKFNDDFDRQLWERRLMRSLEKFVGGKDNEEDLRLLQRII
ncbi:hypothetical protein Tco_0609528 [Tanacetum coccineum]